MPENGWIVIFVSNHSGKHAEIWGGVTIYEKGILK